MPWCSVPPSTLNHITLFGYIVLKDEDDDYMVAECEEKGAILIYRKAPRLWFNDVSDAIQAGALDVLMPD